MISPRQEDITPRPREYPTTPVVGVGAVVIEEDHVLLVRRGREPLKGQWSVPGGVVELGETLEQAVVREVAEETGLIVAPVVLVKTFDRIERDISGRVRFHYVLSDFLCRISECDEHREPRAASDASEAAWAPLRGLSQSIEFPLPQWTVDVVEEAWRCAQIRSSTI